MAEAPTLWDVTFRTAVAQAELEDREVAGAYYRYPFFAEDGTKIYIETTRPELLAACSALVANPDDERYKPLFGKKVTSPCSASRLRYAPTPRPRPTRARASPWSAPLET